MKRNNRKYNIINQTHIQETSHNYYMNNLEKAKECRRKYRSEHRENIKEAGHAYHLKNRDAINRKNA